jgi:hypothetical protein
MLHARCPRMPLTCRICCMFHDPCKRHASPLHQQAARGACPQDLVQLATYSTWIPRRQRSVQGLGVDSVRGLLHCLLGQQAPKLSSRIKAMAFSALLSKPRHTAEHVHVPAIRVWAPHLMRGAAATVPCLGLRAQQCRAGPPRVLSGGRPEKWRQAGEDTSGYRGQTIVPLGWTQHVCICGYTMLAPCEIDLILTSRCPPSVDLVLASN